MSVLALAVLGMTPAMARSDSAAWQADATRWQAAAQGLAQLGDARRRVLETLLQQQAALAETESAIRSVRAQIAVRNTEVEAAVARLGRLDQARRGDVARAADLLRVVQILGSTSLLEVLLAAHSWQGFVHSAGVVAATVDRLRGEMATLRREEVEAAALERRRQAAEQDLLRERQRLVAEQTRLEQEHTALAGELARLGDQAAFFQAELTAVENAWQGLFDPALERWETALNQAVLAAPGSFPAALQGGAAGPLTVTISDTDLNQWLSQTPGVSRLRFAFGNQDDVLSVPSRSLTIFGRFEVAGPSGLAFRFDAVQFAGMPVPLSLLDRDALRLDLSPVLSGFALSSVASGAGELRLTLGSAGGEQGGGAG